MCSIAQVPSTLATSGACFGWSKKWRCKFYIKTEIVWYLPKDNGLLEPAMCSILWKKNQKPTCPTDGGTVLDVIVCFWPEMNLYPASLFPLQPWLALNKSKVSASLIMLSCAEKQVATFTSPFFTVNVSRLPFSCNPWKQWQVLIHPLLNKRE